MRWFAVLLFVLTSCVADARFGSIPDTKAPAIVTNGGILIDFIGNQFLSKDPAGSLITYPSFTAMFSALGGSATTSVKWVYNSAGVMVPSSVNSPAQPCYDGAGNNRGICIENAATNFLLHSSALTSASWTNTGLTVTDNAISAPDGTTTAATLVETTANSVHNVSQAITAAAAPLSFVVSCHADDYIGARNIVVDINDGAGNGVNGIFGFYVDPVLNTQVGVVIQSATPYGTGFTVPVSPLPSTFVDQAGAQQFYRFAISIVTNSATTLNVSCGLANGTSVSYTGDGVSGIAAWGLEAKQFTDGAQQLETAPSSYIPTTTATVTRQVDNISLQLPSYLQNLSTYSEYVGVALPLAPNGLSTTFTSLANSADTDEEAILQQTPSTSSNIALRIVPNGGSIFSPATAGPLNLFGQSVGVIAQFVNNAWWMENSLLGSKTDSIHSAAINDLTKLQLGSYTGGTRGTTGTIGLQQIEVFPGTVSQAALQKILFVASPNNPDYNAPPNYLTPAMISQVGPPITGVWNTTAWTSYPSTHFYGLDMASTVSTWPGFVWMNWGMRCDLCASAKNNRPNLYGSATINVNVGGTNYQGRLSYDSIAAADAAYLTQVAYALGFSAHQSTGCPVGLATCGYLDFSEAGGIADGNVVTYAYAKANAATFFSTLSSVGAYYTALDSVILPNATFATSPKTPTWVYCDCEQDDGHTANQLTTLLTDQTLLAHKAGVSSAAFSDPMLAASKPAIISVGQQTGFCGVGNAIDPIGCSSANGGPNLATLANVLDSIQFLIQEPPPGGFSTISAINATLALFGPPAGYSTSRLGIRFQLGLYPGGLTQADAAAARNFVVANSIPIVAIWPDYALPGGGQCRYTNQKYLEILGLPLGSC